MIHFLTIKQKVLTTVHLTLHEAQNTGRHMWEDFFRNPIPRLKSKPDVKWADISIVQKPKPLHRVQVTDATLTFQQSVCSFKNILASDASPTAWGRVTLGNTCRVWGRRHGNITGYQRSLQRQSTMEVTSFPPSRAGDWPAVVTRNGGSLWRFGSIGKIKVLL